MLTRSSAQWSLTDTALCSSKRFLPRYRQSVQSTYFKNNVHFCFFPANQPFALHLSALAVSVTIQEGLSKNKQGTHTVPGPAAPIPTNSPEWAQACTHRYHHPYGYRHFSPSVWIPEPFLLPSPCAFRESPGITTLASPPAGLGRHRTSICSAFREFLLSSPCGGSGSLRQQSGFACDFAIWECEPGGRTPG